MASLASRLADRDHEITLITFDDASSDRHEVSERVQRVAVDAMGEGQTIWQRFWNHRRRVRRLRKAIRQSTPNVVLSFCDRTNIDCLLAVRPLRTPVVISERSDPNHQSQGRFWEWMRRRTYRRADRLIALTEDSASFLRNISDQVVVIPSAVARPPFRSDRRQAEQEKLIVGVGRLESEKGFDRLIRAFAAATEQRPDWRLKIFGDGSLKEELADLARDLDVAHRIFMPGWVRPIWDPLAEATIFCLSSRYEGFPSALLEAMALGVPSLSVDCPSGPREIIRDRDNGRLCADDEQALTVSLRELIEDAEQRRYLAVRSTEVVQRFSWDKMTRAYETVLSDVGGK